MAVLENNMIFNFGDKARTIKHLSGILEVKKISPLILKIREILGGQIIQEDLLFYGNEKAINSDVNKIFHKLDQYTKAMNDIKKENPIGFTSATGQPINSDDDEED